MKAGNQASCLLTLRDAESRVCHFGCRQQLICMVFAQLTWREGLRDIAICLNARPSTLHHLGFSQAVAKSTLADANEQRDWRLWEDLAKGLMRKARALYAGEDLALDLDNTIYALDSTTIDLSLTLFPWADFRQTKAGIKMHTHIELRVPIPTCIHITGARQHDVGWLDNLMFEAGAFYLMDRVKPFYGTSPNAVKTQIWIAVTTYLMVAIIHNQVKLPDTLHRTLQLLNAHPFAKLTLNESSAESDHRTHDNSDPSQLNLFEL